MSDLGASIQKFAKVSGTSLANAIAASSASGKPANVNITELKAGGGFDGDTPLSQKGAIGRFSVTLAGQVTADAKGNWSMTGSVTGEVDAQDYPVDPARTATAGALTRFGAAVQSTLGGNNYNINFVGSQAIKVEGK